MLLVLLAFFALFKKMVVFFRPICQCISHLYAEKKVFVGATSLSLPILVVQAQHGAHPEQCSVYHIESFLAAGTAVHK